MAYIEDLMTHLFEKTRGHVGIEWGLIKKFSNLTVPFFLLKPNIH